MTALWLFCWQLLYEILPLLNECAVLHEYCQRFIVKLDFWQQHRRSKVENLTEGINFEEDIYKLKWVVKYWLFYITPYHSRICLLPMRLWWRRWAMGQKHWTVSQHLGGEINSKCFSRIRVVIRTWVTRTVFIPFAGSRIICFNFQ